MVGGQGAMDVGEAGGEEHVRLASSGQRWWAWRERGDVRGRPAVARRSGRGGRRGRRAPWSRAGPDGGWPTRGPWPEAAERHVGALERQAAAALAAQVQLDARRRAEADTAAARYEEVALSTEQDRATAAPEMVEILRAEMARQLADAQAMVDQVRGDAGGVLVPATPGGDHPRAEATGPAMRPGEPRISR